MGAAECKGGHFCGLGGGPCSERLRRTEYRPSRSGEQSYGTSGTAGVGGQLDPDKVAASSALSLPRSARPSSGVLDAASQSPGSRPLRAYIGEDEGCGSAYLEATREQQPRVDAASSSLAVCYFRREASELDGLQLSGGGPLVRRRAHHTFRSGAVYDGEWLGSQRDGVGTQSWPDGAVYFGEWKANMASGQGRFTHGDGDMYIGQWSDNHAHGYGVYMHREGTRFEGQFVEDLQEGVGVESWPDGSSFAGDFSQGRKSGSGIYEWVDGSSYAGQWRENKIDGCGMYSGAEGREYRGRWRQSTMHGCGQYCWADGRKYEGHHLADQKSGFGVFTWADERRYEGFWASGRQHGPGRLCQPGPGGEARLALWEKGERVVWLEESPSRRAEGDAGGSTSAAAADGGVLPRSGCGRLEEEPPPALLQSAIDGDGI